MAIRQRQKCAMQTGGTLGSDLLTLIFQIGTSGEVAKYGSVAAQSLTFLTGDFYPARDDIPCHRRALGCEN